MFKNYKVVFANFSFSSILLKIANIQEGLKPQNWPEPEVIGNQHSCLLHVNQKRFLVQSKTIFFIIIFGIVKHVKSINFCKKNCKKNPHWKHKNMEIFQKHYHLTIFSLK